MDQKQEPSQVFTGLDYPHPSVRINIINNEVKYKTISWKTVKGDASIYLTVTCRFMVARACIIQIILWLTKKHNVCIFTSLIK